MGYGDFLIPAMIIINKNFYKTRRQQIMNEKMTNKTMIHTVKILRVITTPNNRIYDLELDNGTIISAKSKKRNIGIVIREMSNLHIVELEVVKYPDDGIYYILKNGEKLKKK